MREHWLLVTGVRKPLRKIVRRAAVAYSLRNRRRKASAILAFLKDHHVKDVLFVGTMGEENRPGEPNAGLIENRIAAQYPIKMSINVEPAVTDYPFMIADARSMPFPDDYVDFALANAIIEHVGQESEQRQMVDEMTRVARSWVITTPNRWFPIESHTSAVFVHWSAGWREKQKGFTRLLSRREFRALLPAGAKVSGALWSPTFTASYARQGE